jgi:hypothetical protein
VNLAQTLAAIAEPHRRYTGASCSNPTLGGGAPTYNVTAEGVLGARVSSDIIPTAVEDHPSHLPVASFPWSIFTVVSSQNEFLS